MLLGVQSAEGKSRARLRRKLKWKGEPRPNEGPPISLPTQKQDKLRQMTDAEL